VIVIIVIVASTSFDTDLPMENLENQLRASRAVSAEVATRPAPFPFWYVLMFLPALVFTIELIRAVKSCMLRE
jgi:hypothetical protein